MKVLPQVGAKPSSPLPKTNSRLGHPTPQKGVEVERKWKRADYTMPGSRQLVQITLKIRRKRYHAPQPISPKSNRATRSRSC